MNIKSRIKETLSQFKRATWRGDKFYCPLCEQGYKKFLPGGTVPRPHAQCPGCGSLERHRLLWVVLQDLWANKQITKGGKMLHVAPELVLEKKFRQNYDYLSVDLNENQAMEVMDITKIDRPDQTFDAIVCNHVLEHIPDDAKAMSELYRVLKVGGWASLQVPPFRGEITDEDLTITDPKQREILYGQFDHVRWYGKDLLLRLQKANFEVLQFPKEKIASPEMLAKLSVASENEVWICLKK